MKVMILAAGRGERMRPLTDRLPKPLVEAGGKPLIAWHLERLAAAGFREAVVNVAHLGEQLIERIGDGSAYGISIAWSREAEPLETAGGLAWARALLGDAPFLLVNSDVYCEFDFRALREKSLDARLAHLVLVPNPAHRPGGDFSLASQRVGNDAAPRYTYSGIAVIDPELYAEVRAGDKAPLAPYLKAAAAQGRLSGELYRGLWRDVGTAERLEELRGLLVRRGGV